MIYGVGHDIVDVSRIAAIYTKHQYRFLRKILSDQELLDWGCGKKNINFLAKRFAAKEAFAKAYGTGLRYPIYMQSITLVNDSFGKPHLVFNESINELLHAAKINKWYVSISDEKESLASAVVILCNT
jgi:holo-[acyl-carrier protein] synthase